MSFNLLILDVADASESLFALLLLPLSHSHRSVDNLDPKALTLLGSFAAENEDPKTSPNLQCDDGDDMETLFDILTEKWPKGYNSPQPPHSSREC